MHSSESPASSLFPPTRRNQEGEIYMNGKRFSLGVWEVFGKNEIKKILSNTIRKQVKNNEKRKKI